MIAGCRVLLLVAGLVLLVDDDEAEVLEGQEDGGTGAKDDVVGMGGELLLPDLHTLGIAVLGVVDAQAVAEDAAQAVHHLNGQGDLGQQVEHLTVLLQFALYEVDVDFRLAAGGHAVKQRHLVLHHGEQNLVVGFLLWCGEPLDVLGTGLAAVVQASHLHLVGLQQAALDELVEDGQGVALVEEEIHPHPLLKRRGGNRFIDRIS